MHRAEPKFPDKSFSSQIVVENAITAGDFRSALIPSVQLVLIMNPSKHSNQQQVHTIFIALKSAFTVPIS